MLNRRATNYIFYGSLVGIVALVFLVRFFALGSINGKIDDVHADNVRLQGEIEQLEILVAENRDVQTEDLYALYDTIPNVFTPERLTFKTVAILETLGIDESDDIQRQISINQSPSFAAGSDLADINDKYTVVQVDLYFTTNQGGVISALLDELYSSEQLFIVRSLDFDIPATGEYVGFAVSFLAIYDLEQTS